MLHAFKVFFISSIQFFHGLLIEHFDSLVSWHTCQVLTWFHSLSIDMAMNQCSPYHFSDRIIVCFIYNTTPTSHFSGVDFVFKGLSLCPCLILIHQDEDGVYEIGIFGWFSSSSNVVSILPFCSHGIWTLTLVLARFHFLCFDVKITRCSVDLQSLDHVGIHFHIIFFFFVWFIYDYKGGETRTRHHKWSIQRQELNHIKMIEIWQIWH